MPGIFLTPEETEWAQKTRPQIGNMLDELNQRCRSYINFMSTSVKDAQKRALEDFKGFYQPGEYVAVKGADKEGPFFVKAGDEPQLLA